MFQSRTGWAGVLVSLVGALTAVDVTPILSEFLIATVGAKAAHLIGVALTLAGLVVAKFSQPSTVSSSASPPAP